MKSARLAVAAALLIAALSVFAPRTQAQFLDASAAAEVASAGGRVSVIRDGQEWVLFPGDQVEVGQMIVTGEDGYAHLEVADGSSFTVYPDSQVVFRKNPGSLKDLLDLFLGRIKVHIQRLGGEPNRNRIFTPTAVISVRGTIFDVSVDDNETTIVTVDEGLVGVTHRLLPSNTEVPVEAGQSLIVYRDTPLAKAGIDKSRVVAVADSMARRLAYIWSRIGRRGGGGSGSSGGAGGGGMPGDTPAPSPPMPGDTPPPEPPPSPEN